jgi:hypothetical protein
MGVRRLIQSMLNWQKIFQMQVDTANKKEQKKSFLVSVD